MTADLRGQLQQTLGTSYTLERELGGGGMSRVFAARDNRLHRQVVVKVLSPELAAGVNAERFEREIQLAASLQQANIVPLLSAGDTNGLPFFTMPFVDGQSLRTRLDAGALPVADVVSILRDVARALSYAHEHGVVHRDIKPDNVLLSHGTAVVTDFGIAKALSASRAASGVALTQTGTSIGTPSYMAPEQVAGEEGVDHRADIYAFGCMAYELLAGQPPFHGKTPAKTLAAHVSETPPRVSVARPDTPPALADLIARCLAKDPDDRPQSAAQLIAALDTSTSPNPAIAAAGPGTGRAIALYLLAFAVVAGAAKLAVLFIGLPEWVFPGALIVMGLGLPVVLLTALGVGSFFTWKRATRGGALALGAFVLVVAGFMVLRALGIGPAGSLLAAGKIHQRDQLILTDFKITNADSTLGRVASDAVRQGLLESNVLTLASPGAVAAAMQRGQRQAGSRIDLPVAQDIAARIGARAIIDGEVNGVAGGYFVTLRLVSADSLTPIASVTATGDGPQGFIDAMDKVTRALRSRAGESLRKVQHTAPLADVTTSSLEALRKYMEAFRANSEGRDPRRSVELAQEAVQLDSTFAMAWRQLGSSRLNAGLPQVSADSAFERAYQLRGRLTERERRFVEATYFTRGAHRERAAAIKAWQRLLEVGNATDSSGAYNYLGIQYGTRREFAAAESAFVMAIRTDSSQVFPYTSRVNNLITAGKTAEARAASDLAVRHNPDQVTPRRQSRDLLYYEGRQGELRRFVDSLAKTNAVDATPWATNWQRTFALQDGKLSEFDRLSPPKATEDLNTALYGAALDNDVRLKPAQAVARVEAALARQPLKSYPVPSRPYLSVAEVYAVLGKPGSARPLIEEYRSVTDTAQRRQESSNLHIAVGAMLQAEHKYAEAIAEYRAAEVLPDGPANACMICATYRIARVFDAAGQADSAIADYQNALNTPQAGRHQLDAIWIPVIHRRLAALYEAKGDARKAVEHYRALIELWKNADAELQPQVEAARAAVRRLADAESRPQ